MNKNIVLILLLLTISCSTSKILKKNDLLYNSTPENLDKFGTFLWSKNKNDSIIFNKQNLDIIKSKKGMYYKSLMKYISFSTSSIHTMKNLKFSEKSKIIAHLIYYANQSEIESTIIEYTILDDEDLKYYNEFEKNNYYNLPNFKNEYRKKFESLKPPKKLEIIKPIIKIQKN